jgi:CheY-like chemotaxis protein
VEVETLEQSRARFASTRHVVVQQALTVAVSHSTTKKMHRGRVLVVDDDAAIRETIYEVLSDEGYEVECAANGRVALEKLDGPEPPRLVLLDLMMPVMSGWELLEEMQESEKLASIPVVVVSAMTAPGARAHLQKPVDLARLLSTVERFFNGRQR